MSNLYSKASLVLTPQLVDTGKVYSIKPEDRKGDFTFTRSSYATRVNADGNIEKETGNLLYQSNNFSSGFWPLQSATITSGQSGYDGSNDAWLLDSSAAGGNIRQSSTISGVNTFSIYAKKGTADGVRIRFDQTTDTNVYIDLRDGSVYTSSNTINIDVQSIGSGWYRVTFAMLNAGLVLFRIYPTDGVQSGVAGTIYIQDAQLEQGLVARDYIDTTSPVYGGITDNTPRLDYTDSSCPALLLEPLGTNLERQSEYIAGWYTPAATINANYTESPEGVNNATRLQFTSTSYLYNGATNSQVNGSKYTMSCYAKRNDSGTQNFGFFRDGSGSVDSAMALTSEWKRFEYTYTATNTSRQGLAGVSGADVSVYGFQIEQNVSYATSYIPTYGSSVSRVVDKVDGQEDASLFNDNEGVLFVEFSALSNTRDNEFRFLISNGSNSERIQIGLQTSGNLYGSVIHSNSSSATFNYTLPNPTQTHKIALKYKANDCALWVDGVERGTDTSGIMPSGLDIFDFYRTPVNNNFVEANVKQVLYFKTALSNEELAALTTI